MRKIPDELFNELTSKNVRAVLMAELFFDTGTLRLWTGYGTLKWMGEEFYGGGNIIGISPIEETQDTEAKGIVCSLNGVPSTIIALALGEKSRGRKFRLYLGFVSSDARIATEEDPGAIELESGTGYILLENQLVDPSAYRIFSGIMDTIEITDNGQTADVRLSVENSLIIGTRQKMRRYTPEDQKKIYPNDKGLEFINQLQDREIVW